MIPTDRTRNLAIRRRSRPARLARNLGVVAVVLASLGMLAAAVQARQARRHTLILSNAIPRELGAVTFQVAAYAVPLGRSEIAPGRSHTFSVTQNHFNTVFYVQAYKNGAVIASSRFGTDAQGVARVSLHAERRTGRPPRYWWVQARR